MRSSTSVFWKMTRQMTSRQHDWCHECVQKHQICTGSLLCNSECLRRQAILEDLCPQALLHIAFVLMSRVCQQMSAAFLSSHTAEEENMLRSSRSYKVSLTSKYDNSSFQNLLVEIKGLCTQGRRLKTVLFTVA